MTVKMTNWLFAAVFSLAILPFAAQAHDVERVIATIDTTVDARVDARVDAGVVNSAAPDRVVVDEEQQLIAAVWEAEEFGAGDPRLAASINMLGAYYHDNGRLAEAEPLYKLALSMARQADGATPLDIAVCLANLATLYEDLGRSDEAAALFENALGLWSAAEVAEEKV